MNRQIYCSLAKLVSILALVFGMVSAQAVTRSTVVKWKVGAIISGLAQPETTTSYFPRPLSNGELVDFTFTIDTAATGTIYGPYFAYESYPNAIKSVQVSGSDWNIYIKNSSGQLVITNDDPDYGDMLDLIGTTTMIPGQTWFSVEMALRNPGGPSPGPGTWEPFTNLNIPKKPPELGMFPSSYFYLSARRDQPGQALDGAAYFGQILWITAKRCDD